MEEKIDSADLLYLSAVPFHLSQFEPLHLACLRARKCINELNGARVLVRRDFLPHECLQFLDAFLAAIVRIEKHDERLHDCTAFSIRCAYDRAFRDLRVIEQCGLDFRSADVVAS